MQENKIPEHVKLMTIMFDIKTNQVNVSGPIGDKVISYGMLQMAHEAIYEYHLRLAVDKNIQDKKIVNEAEKIIT